MSLDATQSIRFCQPQIGSVESARVQMVLSGDYLNEGEVTAEFERALAELLGTKHVITTTSGTTAIFGALMAAGIGRGDEVIVPDITFIATANAVTMAGATPVLVDVDQDSLTICPRATAAAITSRTRAIVPVHVSGRSANMPAIERIAAQHDLMIIEDAAEALASRAPDGRCLGTIGCAGCFSFSPNKIITTGQGGAIATNDDQLAHRLRAFKDQGRPNRGSGGDDFHASVGFNLKFTNLQAAVGLGQLELLPARQKRMREIFNSYANALREVGQSRVIGFDRNENPLWIDVLAEDRDELDAHLRSNGIQGRRFWHPLHRQPPYRQADDRFPASCTVAPRGFWLPSSFLMTDAQVRRVSDEISAFYRAGAIRRAEAA